MRSPSAFASLSSEVRLVHCGNIYCDSNLARYESDVPMTDHR